MPMSPAQRRPFVGRLRLGSLLCICSCGCALALSACGDTLQDQPIGTSTLERLVAVDDFPVYWLGGVFRGMEITGVQHDAGGAFTIQYGDCLVGGQNTCVTPLQIVTSPDNGFRPQGSTAHRLAGIRGIQAIVAEGDHTIELPTGEVIVSVYANSRRLARAAAETTVPINRFGLPGGRLRAALPDTGFGARPLPGQKPPVVRAP
ncbi:MAG TPA: hypothetical protein VLJ42_11100 [Solirubrobacteraceae bacterium]|nr:hypothetical protein [Solirubrobacteraceae bacterium]